MQYVIALGRVIEELRPDVIHTHGLKMHILAAWAPDPGGSPAAGRASSGTCTTTLARDLRPPGSFAGA